MLPARGGSREPLAAILALALFAGGAVYYRQDSSSPKLPSELRSPFMAPLGWAEHGRLPPFPGPEPGYFVPVDYSPDYSFPQPKNPENGFIYPFVPDSPYLPEHWKDVKQGLRHPKGWTRRFDLRGPYVKDLTGVEIEELPPYPTCEAMMEAFKTYGRNGACERISTQDFHALGQIFTRQVMDDCEKQSASECYDNLKLYFRDTIYMAFEGQKISFDTPRPTRIGQLHGSQVMFLGNAAYNNYTANASWVPDWDFIIDVICAGTPESAYHHFHFCMHGVGHAFGYLTIFYPISKTDYHCTPEPTPQIKDGHRAFLGARLCNTAPYSSLARLCNFGVWHGLLEYTVGEHVVTDGVTHYNYMYPCNALPEYSAHCYGQLFAYMGRGDWRWDNIKNVSMAPGGLIKMCTENPTLVNERNVQVTPPRWTSSRGRGQRSPQPHPNPNPSGGISPRAAPPRASPHPLRLPTAPPHPPPRRRRRRAASSGSRRSGSRSTTRSPPRAASLTSASRRTATRARSPAGAPPT